MLTPHAEALLADAVVIWLTTVRPNGQPQASPVWFVMDSGEFLIYSRDGAPRLHNIAANPRVSLNLDSDEGSDVVTVEGEARVVDGPRSTDHMDYQKKYAKHIKQIGYTSEQFADAYSVVIRVKPTRWRVH
jgi:PPOX class probable F420-dependent enzyme